MFSSQYPSPLGRLTLVSDGYHLSYLWFPGLALSDFPDAALDVFTQTKQWLDSYFGGEEPDPAVLPLSPYGTDFQHLVWNLLLEIPYGEVITYGNLAKKAAEKLGRYTMSPQAVGNAVSKNPISIIIPCHRVIGSDGSLTGYSGGLSAKSWLLSHEGAL